MKRIDFSNRKLAELGKASKATRGGPVGYIEATGFLPKTGVDRA